MATTSHLLNELEPPATRSPLVMPVALTSLVSMADESPQPNFEELKSKLTPNQTIFCDEWLVDRNGTRAYRVAYPNIKKDETAKAAASRLLTTVNVKPYIDAKLKLLSDEAGVTVKRVLEEEARLAFSDLRQLYEGETTIAPSELPEDVARALSGIEVIEKTYNTGDGDSETTTTYKYKFWDKGAALNRLGRHLGMYNDKLEVTGLDRLAKRLNEAHKRSDNVSGD